MGRYSNNILAAVGAFMFVAGGLFGALITTIGANNAFRAPEPPEQPQPTREAKPSSAREKAIANARAAGTLEAAIAALSSQMKDSAEVAGATEFALAFWLNEYGTLAVLTAPKNETTFSKAMTTGATERGKRMCASFKIEQINPIPVDDQLSFGVATIRPSETFRFLAVKSTGSLKAGNVSRFCGVVTGRHSYSNSSGGLVNAVMIVGMFDIPENATP